MVVSPLVLILTKRPTVCVRGAGAGAGVDSAWEQKKLEATRSEMLDAKRAARREAAVPSVQCTLC